MSGIWVVVIVAVVALAVVVVVISRSRKDQPSEAAASPAAVAPAPPAPAVTEEPEHAAVEAEAAPAVEAKPEVPPVVEEAAEAEPEPEEVAPEQPEAAKEELSSRVETQLRDSERMLEELRGVATDAEGAAEQVAPSTLDIMTEGLQEVRALVKKGEGRQAKDKGDALHAQLSLLLQTARRQQTS